MYSANVTKNCHFCGQVVSGRDTASNDQSTAYERAELAAARALEKHIRHECKSTPAGVERTERSDSSRARGAAWLLLLVLALAPGVGAVSVANSVLDLNLSFGVITVVGAIMSGALFLAFRRISTRHASAAFATTSLVAMICFCVVASSRDHSYTVFPSYSSRPEEAGVAAVPGSSTHPEPTLPEVGAGLLAQTATQGASNEEAIANAFAEFAAREWMPSSTMHSATICEFLIRSDVSETTAWNVEEFSWGQDESRVELFCGPATFREPVLNVDIFARYPSRNSGSDMVTSLVTSISMNLRVNRDFQLEVLFRAGERADGHAIISAEFAEPSRVPGPFHAMHGLVVWSEPSARPLLATMWNGVPFEAPDWAAPPAAP